MNTPANPATPPLTFSARLYAMAELLRVANVFTAIADVWTGFFVIHALQGIFPNSTARAWPTAAFVGLTLSSSLIYLAGMVLNDLADVEVDAQQRPHRPLPSGRLTLRLARRLGWGLLVAGVASAGVVSCTTTATMPLVTAVALVLLVIGYNFRLKSTRWGPLAMGGCRGLNLLLGMSLAWPGINANIPFPLLLLPLGLALYTTGVTIAARDEVDRSRRRRLAWGTFVWLVGLLLIASVAACGTPPPPLMVTLHGWYWLWLVMALLIFRPFLLAILNPAPQQVQRAIGQAILSLILMDASMCLGFAGPFAACAVLALLAPAMLLAQGLKVT